ncbi:hypothetical protein [Georgenia thermotolerans]|uniref:Uncharacterized protein n=1 Tax=Georgenia thermotolerans TaxID=527326 RepID=A0A7J5UN48_9MICO|nr:hypothetical protein [Georgenia thermotolerans]KAE8763818.1 hypothetical protein GB883_12180 [Georgenia thermotolerans]
MTTWTPEQVRAAAAEWVWVPPDATDRSTADYRLVVSPTFPDCPAQVLRTTSGRPAAELVTEVLARVRALDLTVLCWWVPDDAPDLAAALRQRGGTVTDEVEVLACDLSDGVPDLAVPPDVTATTVTEPRTLLDWHRVAAAVWGTPEPPPGQVAAALAQVAAERARGELRVVGYVGTEPTTAAGCTLAGPVVRLWGAGTRRDWQGRGGYRAVLGERLAQAHWRGIRLALVKARVASSGPILRSVGFAAYGRERRYTLPV